MIHRLPFAYLSPVVDRLYEKQFDPNDIEGISRHCDFIVDYLRANGWSEEQYTLMLFGVPPNDEAN